jgi:hypothetical protein
VAQAGFTEEAADYEKEHAWTLFTGGDPQAAVDKLRALVERLRRTTEFDPAFQLAIAVGNLGKMLLQAGATAAAIPILRESLQLRAALVEKAGGQPWERLLPHPTTPRRRPNWATSPPRWANWPMP